MRVYIEQMIIFFLVGSNSEGLTGQGVLQIPWILSDTFDLIIWIIMMRMPNIYCTQTLKYLSHLIPTQ